MDTKAHYGDILFLGLSAAMAFSVFWVVKSETADRPSPAMPTRTTARPRTEFEELWLPKGVQRASEGYLMTADHIPLRALARHSRVLLSRSASYVEQPEDVAGQMIPWKPYYVHEVDRMRMALQIGETQNVPAVGGCWVRGQDCFCWPSRECVNVEEPTPIYRTLEDVKARKNPLDPAYRYTFHDHLAREDDGTGDFVIPSLPVLQRADARYWCVARPEKEGTDVGTNTGYGVCWLEWDGIDSGVMCRVRIDRRELETYLGDLQSLLLDYESTPEKRDSAKWEMYNRGVQKFTWRDISPLSREQIRRGLDGIPLRVGFMGQRIESELEAKMVRERIVGLCRISNNPEQWTQEEITFVDATMMP